MRSQSLLIAGAYTRPTTDFIAMPKLLKKLIASVFFVGWGVAAGQSVGAAIASALAVASVTCFVGFGMDWEGGNFSRESWRRLFGRQDGDSLRRPK
jgi:hypothetical protein